MPIERMTTFFGIRVPFTGKLVESGHSEFFDDTAPFGAMVFDREIFRTINVTGDSNLHITTQEIGRGWSHTNEVDLDGVQINKNRRQAASPLYVGFRTVYRYKKQ